MVTGADAAAVDAVTGAWLLAHAAARDAAAGDVVVSESDQDIPELLAIMVDGKAVRGDHVHTRLLLPGLAQLTDPDPPAPSPLRTAARN